MEFALPIHITPVQQTTGYLQAPQHQSAGFFAHLWDHFIPHARNNYHPHVFSHRMTGLFSLLLVTLKVFTLTALTFGPVTPAFSSAITPSNIISLTNQSRETYNLGGLKENSMLAKAAQAKADDMLAKGYFAHNTPDGKTPWDFIVATGYNYITAGENLAVNFTEAENVETAWMNSPGHKANILNKNFLEIGIGISQGSYQGHEAIFVVQEFGTQAEQKIAIDDKPTAVQQQPVPAPKLATAPVRKTIETKPVVKNTAEPIVKSQVTPSVQAVPASGQGDAPAKTTAADEQPAVVLALDEPHVKVSGNVVTVSAHASSNTVKVMATMGQAAVMLEPKEGNVWSGVLSLTVMANENSAVTIKAFDVQGKFITTQVAEFAGSTPENYSVIPTATAQHVSIGSFSFDPKEMQQRFYLIFIAGMLASLVLAIGIRRHVQHVPLIANGSFVVMLAALLFMGG